MELQLQTIASKCTDDEILNALDRLPKDLPETFARLLDEKADEVAIRMRKRMFRWLAVAKRPLSLVELREAISLEPLQETWNSQTLVNNIRKVIADCNHLVITDDEMETVHFTHSSVKQYMCSPPEELRGTPFINLSDADAYAGAICITYLNFPEFERRITRSQKDSVGASALTTAVIGESLRIGSSSNRLALRLLHSRNGYDMPLDQLFKPKEAPVGPFEQQFLPYATQFWLHHTRQIGTSNSDRLRHLWTALLDVAETRELLSGVPWTLSDLQNGSPTVSQWTVDQCHDMLARQIMARLRKPHQESGPQRAGRYLFYMAACKPDMDMLNLCLESCRVSPGDLGRGLILASIENLADVAQRLLEAGAFPHETLDKENWRKLRTIGPFRSNTEITIDAWQGSKQQGKLPAQQFYDHYLEPNDVRPHYLGSNAVNPLLAAAYFGHKEVVKVLIGHNVDVNYRNVEGKTAIIFAASRGHDLVVRDLLKAYAAVNHHDKHGWTALMRAATNGHLVVVRELLKAGAWVNSQIGSSHTALMRAAASSRLPIVQELLEAGAEVDCQNEDGRTALMQAATNGHLLVMQELLKAGASFDRQDKLNRTALTEAAANGHPLVVQELLKVGTKVDEPDKDGETALTYAAHNGHTSVVEHLLAAGAEVNHENKSGWTALMSAAAYDQLPVVPALLGEGADVNHKNSTGNDALSLAAGRDSASTVRQLLNAGASNKQQALQRIPSWSLGGSREVLSAAIAQDEARARETNRSGRRLRQAI